MDVVMSGLSHIPIGRSSMEHLPRSKRVFTLEIFVVNISAAGRALITMKGKWSYLNGVSSTKDLDRTRRSSQLQSLYVGVGGEICSLTGKKI
jgi:hypothetical protein